MATKPRPVVLEHRRVDGPNGARTYRAVVHTDPGRMLRAACRECGQEYEQVPPDDFACERCRQTAGYTEQERPHPHALRVFTWGPIPIVPDRPVPPAAAEAYADVHGRELKPGEPFVTESEYVYLQICEMREALDVETAKPAKGRKLAGEGGVL